MTGREEVIRLAAEATSLTELATRTGFERSYVGKILRRAKLPLPGGPRPIAPCGTPAGYATHRRRMEVICDECRAAHAADALARKKRLREVQR